MEIFEKTTKDRKTRIKSIKAQIINRQGYLKDQYLRELLEELEEITKLLAN